MLPEAGAEEGGVVDSLTCRLFGALAYTMILYYLVTVAGAIFMLAGATVLGGYLYYAVYLQAPTQAPSDDLALKLYLVGHALILSRRFLITDVAHRINKRGNPAQAKVLSAKLLGSPDEARDRYWYELMIDVLPDEKGSSKFSTSVTQLFGANALPNLKPGETLPIKYSRKYKQALVVGDGAFKSIRR